MPATDTVNHSVSQKITQELDQGEQNKSNNNNTQWKAAASDLLQEFKKDPQQFQNLVGDINSHLRNQEGDKLSVVKDANGQIKELDFGGHDIYHQDTTNSPGKPKEQTANNPAATLNQSEKGTGAEKPIEYAGVNKTEKTANQTAEEVVSTLKNNPSGHSLDIDQVRRDMVPSARELELTLVEHKPGEANNLLMASTKHPPGMQDNYSANATKETEDKVMNVLTGGKEGNVQLTEAQKTSLSQKDLASIVNQLSPDKETAILTLANLTKNLTALTRNEVNTKDPKWNRTYDKADADKVAAMLQPVGTEVDNKGSDKMGSMYHFYGALAASYFNGSLGKLMVNQASEKQGDPEKAIANTAGAKAGSQLRQSWNNSAPYEVIGAIATLAGRSWQELWKRMENH